MTKNKLVFTILVAVILSISIPTLPNINVVATPDETLVSIYPQTITDIPPSENFSIAIIIENVVNMYGFDIQIKWDPTLIHCVDHVMTVPVDNYPSPVPPSPYPGILHPGMPLANIVDESDSIPGAEAGVLGYWAYSSMGTPSFDGNGTVAVLTFNVLRLGSCDVEFVSIRLSDSSGNPISHTVINGHFSNYVPAPAKIGISPQTIVNSSLSPCQNFTINVDLQEVIDLYSFEYWISYNTSILDATNITVNSAFPPSQTETEILDSQGKMHVSAWLTPPAPSISGDLTLASVKFHVTAAGETVLDLYNVTLTDKVGQNISCEEPLDGYFNNMLVTRIFVNPPELIVPFMKPSDIFSIEIKIENAIGMYDYEFKLSYDIDILTCLGAVVVPPSNGTDFTVEMQINDTEGIIWVKVQYYPPAEPISIYAAKTVTEITFMIQAYGQTVLDLHDTNISDPSGNSMPHEVEDGFFATLLRDVAINYANVTSANLVYPGRVVTIEVDAMNRGNMTTETFNVTVYYDSNPIETKTVTLDPWSATTVTFYWNTSGLTPCNNFTIWAEASQVPYEVNLDNNVFHDGWVKIKMLGDINGDGIIDIYDVTQACAAYGSHEGDPNWNPDADLTSPWGVIDIYDIVTLASHYGETC